MLCFCLAVRTPQFLQEDLRKVSNNSMILGSTIKLNNYVERGKLPNQPFICSLSTKPRSQKVQYLLFLSFVLMKKLQMCQRLLATYDIIILTEK